MLQPMLYERLVISYLGQAPRSEHCNCCHYFSQQAFISQIFFLDLLIHLWHLAAMLRGLCLPAEESF